MAKSRFAPRLGELAGDNVVKMQCIHPSSPSPVAMSRLLYRRSSGPAASLGLLALRLVMGAAFILHGWGKIQSPLSWMPAEAPVPGFLQLLAAVAEFGGGILLILGLLTPLAALGLLCTMIGALLMVHFPNGDSFVMGDSTFELPLTYLSAALLFLLAGPGRLSVDYALFGWRRWNDHGERRPPAEGPRREAATP
jgi:putative oxidoreductase